MKLLNKYNFVQYMQNMQNMQTMQNQKYAEYSVICFCIKVRSLIIIFNIEKSSTNFGYKNEIFAKI